MNIMIFAAHPDDAEVTVGGSICRYTDAGHRVHVVNMTNNGTERVDCAARTSAILGCSCEFLDFADIGTLGLQSGPSTLGIRFDPEHLAVVQAKIEAERPDLVWAHWPVDTHPDHIAAGSLVLRACDNIRLQGNYHPQLWFMAPAIGYQALCFAPDHYEDITPYVERKRTAVAEYACVDIFAAYPIDETATKFYGYASGNAYAEAFVKCHFRVGRERYDVVGEGRELAG
jgi:LmbE family N-acetylglucosaminyl deacetylase